MKLPYKEGTWFAIPLRQGGYATGVVARHVPVQGKIILAYFFGPRRKSIPQLSDALNVTPESAIRIARIGDLGIIKGSWPIIGHSPDWKREEWPIPVFIRRDELAKVAVLVEYADDNPSQMISAQPIPYETQGYGNDGLYAAGAAEIVISKLLI